VATVGYHFRFVRAIDGRSDQSNSEKSHPWAVL
jgi:hypothetical protein